eukprot:149337-Chlamydomonas_euryale.AAC.2
MQRPPHLERHVKWVEERRTIGRAAGKRAPEERAPRGLLLDKALGLDKAVAEKHGAVTEREADHLGRSLCRSVGNGRVQKKVEERFAGVSGKAEERFRGFRGGRRPASLFSRSSVHPLRPPADPEHPPTHTQHPAIP